MGLDAHEAMVMLPIVRSSPFPGFPCESTCLPAQFSWFSHHDEIQYARSRHLLASHLRAVFTRGNGYRRCA